MIPLTQRAYLRSSGGVKLTRTDARGHTSEAWAAQLTPDALDGTVVNDRIPAVMEDE
jgi:hypothetical protein